MTDRPSGLRFDIYERVHLPEHLAAINELEEIELMPHVQVENGTDQVWIKGHLRLSGKYVSEGQEQQQFEHAIPVEISLPMHRSEQPQEIGVNIDNFDVDLISARTINVTGVLSLQGITLPTTETETTPWQEEEIVFVHQATEQSQEIDREPPRKADPHARVTLPWQNDSVKIDKPQQAEARAEMRSGAGADMENNAVDAPQPQSSERDEQRAEMKLEEQRSLEDQTAIEDQATIEALEDQQSQEEHLSREVSSEDLQSHEELQSEIQSDEELQAQDESPAPEDELVSYAPQKRELKIAFTGVERDENRIFAFGVSDSSKSSSKQNEQDKARQVAEQKAQDQAPEQSAHSSDTLEWKTLFLSANQEEQFSRMRMCIVQREESVETIAARYGLNPREIMLYNRLINDEVNEGQILYIPR